MECLEHVCAFGKPALYHNDHLHNQDLRPPPTLLPANSDPVSTLCLKHHCDPPTAKNQNQDHPLPPTDTHTHAHTFSVSFSFCFNLTRLSFLCRLFMSNLYQWCSCGYCPILLFLIQTCKSFDFCNFQSCQTVTNTTVALLFVVSP